MPIAMHVYIAFVVTTLIIMSVPDASKMLILSRSASGGTFAGLFTLIGVKAAEAIQVVLVSFGLSWLIVSYPYVFEAVTVLGAAYLIYLGLRRWRAASRRIAEPSSQGSDFLTGFMISIANPKTLIFLAALFPHFLNHAHPVDAQFVVLGTTFLLIATCLDLPLVLGGGLVERFFRSPRVEDVLKRFNSGVLLTAGVFLMGLLVFR